jgi:NTE family protein
MSDNVPTAAGFTGLPDALQRRARLAKFPPGSPILREGEPVEELYLLTSGTVSIVLGARSMAKLGPGAWLGELAMLTGGVSSTSVLAETEVEAISVTQADFLAAAEEDPTIFRQLAQMLAQRLRSTDRMLSDQQSGRIALLWHEKAQTPLVDAILTECRRWAPVPLLILWNGAGSAVSTPAEHLAEPSLLAALERKIAAGAAVTLPTGNTADPALSVFLGLASQFAPLIVLAVSEPISPTTMPRVTETISLTNDPSASALTTSFLDVPHAAWKTGQGFDAGRIARSICRQRIGLALGGGAARGFAHLGVLKALQEAHVPVDVVVGTSIGAAIAASIAVGEPLEEIARAMEVTGRAAMMPQLIPAHSIFTSFFLEAALKRRFGRLRFRDLALPLGITAVDLDTAEELLFTSGKLVPALMASMAVPGIFPPVRHEGRILVDGGLRVPVPAAACRSLGADTVVASRMRVEAELGRSSDQSALPLMADSFSQALDIMQDQIGVETIGLADVAIDTAIPRRYASLFDFRHRAFVEAAGERAALNALTQIYECVPGLRRVAVEAATQRAA